ncbi:hypothetical protein EDD53_2667 [Pacificibacter maritimus]|uniref:Uncharacterized protein n=2 Tax=Pacificibacter maritimus TaxID=762213 RepID=A0A3N4TX90_9RHOB|nr:hypothetical protein EDD53_2667 [Pacificibacter maritimus]
MADVCDYVSQQMYRQLTTSGRLRAGLQQIAPDARLVDAPAPKTLRDTDVAVAVFVTKKPLGMALSVFVTTANGGTIETKRNLTVMDARRAHGLAHYKRFLDRTIAAATEE